MHLGTLSKQATYILSSQRGYNFSTRRKKNVLVCQRHFQLVRVHFLHRYQSSPFEVSIIAACISEAFFISCSSSKRPARNSSSRTPSRLRIVLSNHLKEITLILAVHLHLSPT